MVIKDAFHFFLSLELALLLRLFAFGDMFAECAGIFAVEGALDGLNEGICAKVIREHSGPGH